MRNRTWLTAATLLLLVLGAGACRKYITHPTHRLPVISSVVAFPTVLGPGDSTMITISATDPDGDSLSYDWSAYNGLTMKDGRTYIYDTGSPSMVFLRSPAWTYPYDTAFVWCAASDRRGGSDRRRVLILYRD